MDRKPAPMVTLSQLVGAAERLSKRAGTRTGADWLGLVEAALDATSRRPLRLPPIPQFEIHTGEKKRTVAVLPSLQRLICEAIRLPLTEAAERVLPDSVHSFRAGRSIYTAVGAAQQLLQNGCTALMFADIDAFFPGIHPRLACDAVATLTGEDWADWLYELLRTPVRQGDDCRAPDGLLLGNPLSPVLSNLVLLPLDRHFASGPLRMLRYGDDMLFAAREPELLDQAARDTEELLQRLSLRIQPAKTRHLVDDGRPITWLGLSFDRKHVYQPRRLPAQKPAADNSNTITPVTRPPAQTLYVSGHGLYISFRNGHYRFRRGDTLVATLPASRVDRILMLGSASLSTGFIAAAIERRTPVIFFVRRGARFGTLAAASTLNPLRLRAQYALRTDPAVRLRVARYIVERKLDTQLQRLRRCNPPSLSEAVLRLRNRCADAEDIQTLTGIEGSATRLYWRGFASRIRHPDFAWQGRSRRPPRDPVNSLLSFAYSLMFSELHTLLLAHGLDPYPGFLHELHRNHPALASDLLEPYRALLADVFVLTAVNGRWFSRDDFETGARGGVLLKGDARRLFLERYEAFMTRQLGPGEAACTPRALLAVAAGSVRRLVTGETDQIKLPLRASELTVPIDAAWVIGDHVPWPTSAQSRLDSGAS